MNTKFNFIPGQKYGVISDRLTNGIKYGIFNKAFNSFDARHHGAGNPDDYIAYEFQQIPENFGTFTLYQFQIKGFDDVKANDDAFAAFERAHPELNP